MKKNPINLQSKLVQFLTLVAITIIWYFSEISNDVDYATFPVMLALGIAQMGFSAYDKKKAQDDMINTQTQLKAANNELEKIKYTNELDVLTAPKNQVAMDQLGQQTTQIIDAAQEGGQRGVLGATGKVNQLFDKGTMKVSQADLNRQYERDVDGLVAQRESRRNEAIDFQNRAYMEAQKAPTLLDTVAEAATLGLNSYIAFNRR